MRTHRLVLAMATNYTTKKTMRHYDVATIAALFLRIIRASTTWVLAVYVAVAAIITFPFIIHPRTTLTAPIASDTSSSVSLYGAFVRENTNPFMVPRASTIAAPDGIKNNVGVNRASFLSTTYLWVTSLLFGPIMAHSSETFLGFFITAAVTFFFVKAVTRSRASAFVAGLAYGFWPHMLSLGRAAPTYTHMWLFILPLWAFWLLITKGVTKKRIGLAFASVLPALFWTPYYTFHIMLIALACVVTTAWYVRRQIGTKKTLQLAAALGGGWLLMLGAYYLLGMSNSNTEIPMRTLAEAYEQSAHPLMYLLPGESSLWGKPISETLVRVVPRAAHTNLYAGLSLIALAIFGLVTLLRAKQQHLQKELANLRPAAMIGGLVIFICFLFSLPPTVYMAGHAIPTPNQLVADAVPALRASQRLVMPLMSGLVLLAGLGVYMVVRRCTGRTKYLLLAAIVAIVGVDLWSPYPDAATKITPSPVISQLQRLPAGRVAQYQRSSLVGYPGQTMCLAQLYHKKPIINDCGMGRSATDPATPSPQLAAIVNTPLCDQLPKLQHIRVRYVIAANDDTSVLACLRSLPTIATDSTYTVFTL